MAEPYRSTPVFDEATLPAALRNEHRTKDGVWGLIRVLEGELKLTYVEPRSEKVLRSGNCAIVCPGQTHFVTPIGAVRMQVDFYSEPPRP